MKRCNGENKEGNKRWYGKEERGGEEEEEEEEEEAEEESITVAGRKEEDYCRSRGMRRVGGGETVGRRGKEECRDRVWGEFVGKIGEYKEKRNEEEEEEK